MFPCFLFLSFTSAGVQVFVGFKIVDNQAGVSSLTNAGQSCAVSLPLFCSYPRSSRVSIVLDFGYRKERSPMPLCVSDFPKLQPYGARIVLLLGAIYDAYLR